jgi:hypothetical protein
MSRPKRRPVIVTGPHPPRLPTQRGSFISKPSEPPPIEPTQIRKADQIRPGSSVRITNPDQSRKELR